MNEQNADIFVHLFIDKTQSIPDYYFVLIYMPSTVAFIPNCPLHTPWYIEPQQILCRISL